MTLIQKYFNKINKGDNKLRLLDQGYLPRWIVILLDVFLCIISLGLVYAILFNTPLVFPETISLTNQALLILVINLCYFFVFKTYSGIIRHSTFTDILKLAFSSFSTVFTAVAISYLYFSVYDGKLFITTSVVLYMLLSFMMMLLFRIAVKEIYQFLKN